MIQEFVDKVRGAEEVLKQGIRDHPPGRDAAGLFRRVVEVLAGEYEGGFFWDLPDPERIHVIDDGDYQGTQVLVVGAQGYQPSNYWAVSWGYGSCGGCDVLEAICDSETSYDFAAPDDPKATITERGVQDFYSVMLHMVEGMVAI